MHSSTIRKLTSAWLIAMIIAPAALADGSPPGQRGGAIHISRQRVIQGDGQNLRTSPEPASHVSSGAASPGAGLATEAAMRAAAGKARSKQAPTPSVVLVRTSSSFQWGDAGIGAAAAAGAILLLLGALLFTRTPRAGGSASITPQLGTSER